MKTTIISILIAVSGAFSALYAQESDSPTWQGSVSFTQNAASLGNPFSGPLHPGLTLAAARPWKDSEHHQLYQSFRLGYFHHQYVQHALSLTTELGYKYKFGSGLAFAPVIGGGYVHSIPTEDQFKLQADGTYKQVARWGRANGVFTLGANLGYNLAKISNLDAAIFFSYRFSVQGTFIHQTVPMIVYSTAGIGVAVPLK